MGQLEPVREEPIDEKHEQRLKKERAKINQPYWKKWSWIVRNHMSLVSPPPKRSNIKILLSVLGCPLSPVPLPSLLPQNISSKAQYIIQQFRGATQMGKSTKNLYASGDVTMAMMTSGEDRSSTWSRQRGSFVVWEMDPGMWLLELVVDGTKIAAGCNGKTAWRHTPWIGTHAAPGGARPLRRSLQGLNPSTITSVFSTSQFMGEKEIDGENCFALMLEVDQPSLTARSDCTSEVIKHVMVGYFSQRTGLLLQLDDFQLSRFKSPGTSDTPIFWETTVASHIRDYRQVDGGVVIAHSGRSVVNLVRFGKGVLTDDNERTRMEEDWNIHDVAFNVQGLTGESFIPPEEVRAAVIE